MRQQSVISIMDSILHADIFFVITSVSVVVITILACVCSYFIIKILANVRYITDKARKETDYIAGEMKTLREKIGRNKYKVFAWSGLIYKLFRKYKKY